MSLGEIATFTNGYSFGPDHWGISGKPIIRIQNLTGSSKEFNKTNFDPGERYHVARGDLLVSWSASLDVFVWEGEDSLVNQHIFKVAPKKELITKDYMFYALKNVMSRLKQVAHGSTMKHVNRGTFLETTIPLPPLEEQKRIAAILDKADAIRKKRQRAIELADQFLRSVFLDMFGDPFMNPKGWQRAKFEELIDSVTYGLTVRPNYVDEGLPLISAREIRTGQIDFSGAPRISEGDFEKLSQKAKPSAGDILFSKTGSIGHSALVEDGVKFAVTQNAARITPCPEKCTPVFLLSLLRTKFFKDLANREAKGNAVKDLQLGVIKNFNVYLPPIALQRAFSAVYRQHMQHAMKHQESSKSIESLANGLSLHAFIGKLTE